MNASRPLPEDAQPCGDIALEHLYPALLQCFAVILSGYAAGRMNLISETEAKGLNTFVGCFSLPCLIFLSLAELDLSAVKWMFLAAVLVAKGAVFAVVVVVTLLVGRPVMPARAGLFAIFCTQSNDFAIGYPIVAALYANTHPDYASYLYLMAPISLVILNPVGCVLMEISKSFSVEDRTAKVRKLRLMATVAKSIVRNPVVFMTLLGMLGNVVFFHHLPVWIRSILQVFGSAFAGTALFLLGLRMVGKWHTMQGTHLVVPCILIGIKLVALPLVIREIVSQFHVGVNVSDNLDLSTYGFLYGTFPAAPGVFVYAMHYNVDVDLIALAMVACTFISAPWMFISAKMITIDKVQPSKDLDDYSFDVSVVGIVASVWLLVMFVCTGKYKNALHRVTCCLVTSQLVTCVGAVLWTALGHGSAWSAYLQYVVYATGAYSSRLWTALLAATLHALHSRSLCFVLRLHVWFIVCGWGIPLLMVTLIMVLVDGGSLHGDDTFISFQYGVPQAALSSCFMAACFVATVVLLIQHERHQRRNAQYHQLANDVSRLDPADATFTSSQPTASTSHTTDIEDLASPETQGPGLRPGPLRAAAHYDCQSVNCEDCGGGREDEEAAAAADEGRGAKGRGTCPPSLGCSAERRADCEALVGSRHELDALPGADQHQVVHHQVLLLLLSLSLFVGIAVSVWTAVMDEISGIYVELAFLDATLNLGQSVIVFAVFLRDSVSFVTSHAKRLYRRWWGSMQVLLPPFDELDFETRHVCGQFATHHLDKCRREIAQSKRCRLHYYKDVFKGSELVDWLVLVGLARERVQAVHYAGQLLDGRVIRHVQDRHHFLDSSLLYTFGP